MSAIHIPDNHFILESANDIDAICQPFMELFDLTYFDYCRIYDDGRMSILASNPYWVKHFFSHNYPAGGEVRKKGMYLWPTHLPADAIMNARQAFNHDHGMTAIYEHKDHIEFFDFATKRDNHKVLYYYLNHFDIFEKFMHYFRQKAKPLINRADEHCLSLNVNSENVIIKRNVILLANHLLSPESPKRLGLTSRQLTCLQLLGRGMSMRQIGESLDLSRRTVEHHIEVVKKKLNCETKVELIAKLSELNDDFNLSV